MLTIKEFEKYTLKKKYNLLKKEGAHIASRIYQDFNVHLFSLHGHYIEAWYKLSLNQLYWIEVVKNKETLNAYTNEINIKDLGLK